MSHPSPSRTGSTLYALLRDPTDPQNWGAFVERYGRQIYGWCRRWGLQEADAQDMTQNVLTKLVRRMRTFRYDPGKGAFRSWLKAVTDSAQMDLVADRRRPGAAGTGDSDVQELIQTAAANDDLTKVLQEEYERELLAEAMARVQLRVSPRDWEVFSALARDGRSGKEVAAEYGMSVAAAFMAKSRVQQKLADEVARLEGTDVGPQEAEW
jgi:RNA polymerase sigma factor (sigma-70 family)